MVDPLAERALDLGVPGMADQDNVAPGAAMPGHFHVHLGHQRAGRIEHPQAAFAAGLAHGLGNTMRGEYHGRVVRDLVEFVDEDGTGLGQAVHDEAVVDDFVAHVDGRAEQVQRPLDDLDGPVHTGAESARIGEQNIHQAFAALPRLNSSASSNSRITPQVMAESATLNAG